MSELSTALAAAHAAGAILRERWPAAREVRFKGARDIVTEADVAAQAAIADCLKAGFPEYSILAEEDAGPGGAGDLCPTWIVDPLDGTTNYAHRLPTWSVAIGLLSGSELRLGVVYDPLRDLTFYAERGQGAHLLQPAAAGPQPLAVSATAAVEQAVIALDWAHAEPVRAAVADTLKPVALACASVRSLGSAALAMCYLAGGWLDAYFNFALQPWDIAGPSVIALEAGARISAPDGRPWQLGQSQAVITNGHLHDTVVRLMGAS
jgi:myo-inositol-1(or 4)-monophosphatase